MIIKITCPSCAHKFAIEPTAAMREIERLKLEVSDLKAKMAAMDQDVQSLDNLRRMFGMDVDA